ncbi:PAS domain S-box protein [Solidesulfovibrio sp. C21]|uniref:PAS domain-containing sensor histidine kinase n=1 Tax=Solidesulfovibrio sp. C21 TaxID=3398613 RepID=UPI0039FC9A77
MEFEQQLAGSAHLEAMYRYKKLYEMLLEAIPSSVLLIDRDLRIVSANRNFFQKMRCSLENTIGFNLSKVLPAIILDQVDIIGQIRRVFDDNKDIQGERLTYRAPGIPLRIYYYSILPFSWQGTVETAMLLMDDVTEKVRLNEEVRRVERHLASIVESASDIIVSTDLDGSILTWNPSAEEHSGFKFYQVRGRTFFDLCMSDHHEDILAVFSNLRAGRDTQMGEWSLMTSDGSWIQVSWVCSPMRDHQGQTTGMVAVGRDLSERRKQEAQLLQLQKLAALGVMAGGIAHELRNPLAICVSAAQFIQEDNTTDEFRQLCAQKILTGIKRASVIIENLLRFARPAALMELREINLLVLLESTLDLISNQAKIQKVDIIRHLPGHPLFVSGIEGLLQQAFLNIYLNAIHAMMPEGGAITTEMEINNDEIHVRIADTGHGISPEYLDKIFDPFYTTWPVGQGMGLGLSICYSIIKQHGGSIEVSSNCERGTMFTVTLSLVNTSCQ